MQYKRIYATLNEALDRATQQERDPKTLSILRQMQKLSSPWITAESLRTAERHVLTDVLRRAENLRVQLFGDLSLLRRWTLRVLSLCSLLAVAGGLYQGYQAYQQEVHLAVRSLLYRMQYQLGGTDPLNVAAILLVIVLVGGVWLLKSTKQF